MPAAQRTTLSRNLTALLLALCGITPPALAQVGGAAAPATAASAPVTLRIVGGLAGVNQFTRHEEPFWRNELPRLSGGRLRADIVAFDRAGIRGQDMLRLMQLGVVPFGTALLSLSATAEPLLGAADLAGLNPDAGSLRRHTTAFRPLLDKTLREKYGIELLALYVYPAQMLFCKRPLVGLADLSGRRVRTASATQADWVEALGGKAVTMPFAELTQGLRSGGLDCAITGSMSGFTIGLHQFTTHVYTMPVSWGLAMFGANAGAWAALPADQRAMLRQELLRLEQAIWAESERETGDGVRCLTGTAEPADCGGAPQGQMTAVAPQPPDERRRREVLAGSVLPRWVQRCGSACAAAWNQTIGPVGGTEAKPQ
ncbi:MAG: TRAP transporter substrate-binding protein [Pseudomonadota bacterium]